MVTLDAIREPVRKELEEFEAFVRRNFKVENELLAAMVDYILSTRGKGVRPLLVLLSAGLNAPATGRSVGQRTYLAAMLVEIIHTASLVHDDVIDESDTRRGRASANAKWQSRNAVVLGDFLLARNMEIGMRSAQYDIVSYVISSIALLCEGELLQNDHARKMEVTRNTYLDIIYKKTASLLGISAGVGALSVGADRGKIAEMRRFGDALGMAFQIQDDILDYTRGAHTGKPSNNDLREHKITLPLLLSVTERSLTPLAVSTVNSVEVTSPRVYAYLPTLRSAFPHICASVPSRLYIIIRRSALSDGAMRTRPSLPMPYLRCETKRASAGMS